MIFIPGMEILAHCEQEAEVAEIGGDEHYWAHIVWGSGYSICQPSGLRELVH